MSNVETIGDKVTIGHLSKMSVDPNLEGFMVVAFMKDGTVNVGWSDMTNEQMAFGKMMFDIEVMDNIKQQRGELNDGYGS